MYHMTLLHWIVVAVFIFIFLLLSLLSLKEKKTKTILIMIISSFIVTIIGIVFSLFTLDKYVKKAELLNVTHKRISLTESMQVRGKVKNIGDYQIGYCNIEVKIANVFSRKMGQGSMFSPRSFGDMFSSTSGTLKSNLVLETFKIAKNLQPNKVQKFSLTLKYPPHFEKPVLKYKLFCY